MNRYTTEEANSYVYDPRVDNLWTKVKFHMIPALSSLINTVNSIPKNIYTGTIDVTNQVANSMQEIGDVYTKGTTDQNSLDIVAIKQVHFDYLQSLRKQNKKKYLELLKVLELYQLLQQSGKTELQNKLLILYFTNRIKLN